MTYAFDPELARVVPHLPAISMADVYMARKGLDAVLSQIEPDPPTQPVNVREAAVPGPTGAPAVTVRIYSPAAQDGALPGLLHIHGGGFISGGVAQSNNDCIRIAASSDAVVVSVEYRLAPEHPFPAGVEDCYAALLWTAAHAAGLGIDPAHLGVGGESAGGGLSAAVALMARDRGGPALCFQWLGIPELDDRFTTASMRQYTDVPMLNAHEVRRSWDHYLGAGIPGTADVSPYAAPARAADLTGLPPTFITACEFDPLRDESLDYALRLIASSVPTSLIHYPGTFHGSHFIPAAISRRMIADQLAAVRLGLHGVTLTEAVSTTR